MTPAIRIAIFEDNQQFRESLEFVILSEEGLELCGSFEDTNRLLKKVEQASPDLILMDINIDVVYTLHSRRLGRV